MYIGVISFALAILGFLTAKAHARQTQYYIQTSAGSAQCQITLTNPWCRTFPGPPCLSFDGRQYFISVTSVATMGCKTGLTAWTN